MENSCDIISNYKATIITMYLGGFDSIGSLAPKFSFKKKDDKVLTSVL